MANLNGVVVFLGPTLSSKEAALHADATYLPPAACGDLYRAARQLRPAAIALIDGLFGLAPSVWHKEILWAMSEGIHVFGAASMGALRAAELHIFGMEGIGEVFASLKSGVLTDDDEVAVLHGPPEMEFCALSDAMVNIRASVANAVADGIVSQDIASSLIDIGKRLHYVDRTYARILKEGREAGLREIDELEFWLRWNAVDQKRLDAVALLDRLADQSAICLNPKEVSYRFQHTDAWEQLRRTIERSMDQAPADPPH